MSGERSRRRLKKEKKEGKWSHFAIFFSAKVSNSGKTTFRSWEKNLTFVLGWSRIWRFFYSRLECGFEFQRVQKIALFAHTWYYYFCNLTIFFLISISDCIVYSSFSVEYCFAYFFSLFLLRVCNLKLSSVSVFNASICQKGREEEAISALSLHTFLGVQQCV